MSLGGVSDAEREDDGQFGFTVRCPRRPLERDLTGLTRPEKAQCPLRRSRYSHLVCESAQVFTCKTVSTNTVEDLNRKEFTVMVPASQADRQSRTEGMIIQYVGNDIELGNMCDGRLALVLQLHGEIDFNRRWFVARITKEPNLRQYSEALVIHIERYRGTS